MKAIILTAGYGRRMRPLTNQTHKTLLTVAGRTIIERIVEGLVDNGITDIAIVTGYRRDELTAFLTSNFPEVRFSLKVDGRQVLHGFEKRFGSDLKLFGGLAGDDLALSGTYIFTNNKFSGNGIIAIAFDEDTTPLNVKSVVSYFNPN